MAGVAAASAVVSVAVVEVVLAAALEAAAILVAGVPVGVGKTAKSEVLRAFINRLLFRFALRPLLFAPSSLLLLVSVNPRW